MSILGTCPFCKGPLCTRNAAVECSDCGRPQPDHPLSKAAAAMVRPKVNAATYQTADFLPNGLPPQLQADKVLALEKRAVELDRKVAEQDKRIAALESLLGGKSEKPESRELTPAGAGRKR